MMMFKKEMSKAVVVVCLLVLTDRSTAIEPSDGANITIGQNTGPQVATAYLTNQNVTILDTSSVTLAGGANVTIAFDPLVGQDAAWSSGTFTDGLAGGLVINTQTVGGIGIDKGIVLCTGRVQDRDPVGQLNVGRLGVDGPNEAVPEDNPGGQFDQSTVSKVFFVDDPPDGMEDTGDVHLAKSDGDVDLESTGDRCALEFEVNTTEPGYFQVKVVFASDEYPDFLDANPEPEMEELDYDDTFGVFVHASGGSFEAADNIAVFRSKDDDGDTIDPDMPFSMLDCQDQTQIYIENQSNPPNEEMIGAEFYNHEYNFFTKKLLIESREPFAPGQYIVKIVIHDVGQFGTEPNVTSNLFVDSALFIEAGSFRVNSAPLMEGDYNGNAQVEQGDLDLVLLNWGDPVPPYPDGWVNDLPTGNVDQDELDRVLLNWGNEGKRADFDRDGDVDAADLAIWTEFNGIDKCVLRTMGDADDDGDVDECDLHWWEYETGLRPSPPNLSADNCNGMAMIGPQGESFYCAEAEGPLEPIPAPEVVAVEEGFNPYLRNRVAAVAEILLIAEGKWYGGRPQDSLRIWAGLARVYGKQVVPAWAASMLE